MVNKTYFDASNRGSLINELLVWYLKASQHYAFGHNQEAGQHQDFE
jgi:hypothetical protein